MFYAKSTGGFYATEIHGDNIPADAQEITAEDHAALLAGQSDGKIITADADGYPYLADPPPPSPNQIILAQIAALESSVNDRRLRESVLGIDGGWLKSLNDQVAQLRALLT